MIGTRPDRVSGEVSELGEIFGTIKDTITSLMQTSIFIRDATPRDRFIKALSSTSSPFPESFDIAHVGHKFPKIDVEGKEWLKGRLGKAIAQRRQYLKYCRQHHDKFSLQVEQNQTGVKVPSKSESSFDDVTLSGDVGLLSKSQYETSAVHTTPTSAFASTDASTLHPSKLGVIENIAEDNVEDLSESYSQTSYATSVQDNIGESRLQTPSLKDITDAFPFECPFCWTMQGKMSEKSWR